MILVRRMKVLEQLASLAPKRKPATSKELAAIAAVVGRLPDDLRALYEVAGNLDRVGAEEGLEWLSPSGAVANWKMNRKVVDEFPAHVLPIATDNAGNFACYDTKTGRIVDWDHETRKVTALAPSLEKYVTKELVARLRAEASENAAIAGAKKISAGAAPSGMPSKIVQESFPMLAKVDRPGYGGGARAILFLSDDRLLVLFNQTATTIQMGGKEQTHVSLGAPSAMTPDGKRVLCADFGDIGLIDTKSCKIAGRWCVSQLQSAVAIAVSPLGIAAITDSGGLFLFDTKKLKNGSTDAFKGRSELPKARPLASLPGHDGSVFCAFAGDGVLASGDEKGRLCTWRGWRGKKLAAKTSVKGEIRCVAFSKDGERLFVGLASGSVEVRDRKLARVAQWKTKDDDVSDLRVLASGAVATVGHKLLQIWDPANGKLLAKIARKKGQTMPRICDERGALLVTTGPAALYRLV
jgi:hypothetical protein